VAALEVVMAGPRPVLVLASASPARLRLLQRSGLDPEVHVSDIDEEAAVEQAQIEQGRTLSVAEQTLLLARAKADAVLASLSREFTGSPVLVIGCDTTLELDGQAHNKPAGPQEATARWAQMSGRTGLLHTGHALRLRHAEGHVDDVDEVATATVHFGTPDAREVAAYVASGEPIRVAGAFTLEGLGGPFIDRIEGDPSCIEGLSLPTFRRMLAHVGWRWTDLWTDEHP
jgi:septum formation protein